MPLDAKCRWRSGSGHMLAGERLPCSTAPLQPQIIISYVLESSSVSSPRADGARQLLPLTGTPLRSNVRNRPGPRR